MMAISRGERPPRPPFPALTNGLWELMKRCWDQDSRKRPRILEVLLTLNPPPPIRKRTCPDRPSPTAADMSIPVLDIQEQLESLNNSDKDYRLLLHALLSHRDLRSHIEGLKRDDLQGFVELLDKVNKADVQTHWCLLHLIN